MKILLWFLFIQVSFAKESNRPSPIFEKEVKTKDFKIRVTQYKNSLNGNFYFSLIDYSKIPVGATQIVSMNTGGIVRFQRTFVRNPKDPKFSLVVSQFKKIRNELYSYFISKYVDGPACPAEIQFLDSEFNDSIASYEPNRDSELDCHDVATSTSHTDQIFYLFYRKDKGGIDPEVQARDSSGKITFSWLGSSYFPPVKNTYFNDPLHLNSIDFTPKGDLILGLNGISTVALVNLKNGKMEEKISNDNWKFENDSRGGFKNQHSVHMLNNGNLIIYDNGSRRNLPPRAVEYKLNYHKKIATLVWEYEAKTSDFYRSAEGSVQRLSNGNTLIGWGVPTLLNPFKKLAHNSIAIEIDSKGGIVRELWSEDALVSPQVYFEEK